MQELKEMMIEKLKLMKAHRVLPNKPADIDMVIDQLLKEKRKETSRSAAESRLLKSLSSTRIQAPYKIQEFYDESISMMKMYNSNFQPAPLSWKQNDQIGNIVHLYGKFFREQGSERRANELDTIFQRKLCERGATIPTIFNWFTQWLSKAFKNFLKTTINELNLSKKPEILHEARAKSEKIFLEDLNLQKISLSLIDQQIKNKRKRDFSLTKPESKLLNPIENHLKVSFRQIKKTDSISNYLPYQYQIKVRTRQKHYGEGDTKHLPGSPNSSLSAYLKQIPQMPQEKLINLNKQIFFSAFFDEMSNYYKMYSIMGGLDQNFPRSFRKVDRRDQINKNLNVLVKSMTRNQPNNIKQTISSYIINYETKYGPVTAKKESKKEIKIERYVRRAESVDTRQTNIKQNGQKGLNISSEIVLRQIKSTVQSQIKHAIVDLQLPSINQRCLAFPASGKRSIQKSSFSSLSNKRYKKQQTKNCISAELSKQLRQISSLFKNQNRKKELLDQILNDNQQSILLKFEGKDNHSESFKGDGIFRLPRINN